ncbi:MAG: hypothetical protein JW909_01225 [Planctomycetes bacterium]|nr:hypothetical protein [Planctomycetota bacterium]
MPREIIPPVNAPAPVGAYSQAVRAAGLVFLSGQIPVVPETGEIITSDVSAATEQCLANLRSVLSDAGLTLDDVVSVTVFLADINDFPAMNDVYSKYFPSAPPARTAVQVAALPKGAPIEIQAVAHEF